MSRCDALLDRAISAPGSLTFAEVCRLAECWGYAHRNTRGSHHKYKHRHLRLPLAHAMATFQKGKNGEAKRYQVEQLTDMIAYVRDAFPDYDPDDPATHAD